MQFNDQVDVALLLTARLKATAEIGQLTPREFWSIHKRLPDLRQLVDTSTDGLRALVPGTPGLEERIVRLIEAGSSFVDEREQMAAEGLELISAIGDSFPERLGQRLGDACPPTFLLAGQRSLLASASIGVVGSRNVTAEGANVARAAGCAAAKRGFTLVSGSARGVDSIAASAALHAGGASISIPSEGLRRILKRGDIDLSKSLYMSPLSPDAKFTAGYAMARNKVIYALALKTLVVASDDSKGGTWQGASEALRRNYGAVAVWRGNGQGPGNRGLEQRGGQRITDIGELFNEEPSGPAQLGLDFS